MDRMDPNRQDNHSPSPRLPNQREQKQQEKKCRGNRRDQRFRRQCRARGMKPAKIEKLLRNRNQINHNNHHITTDNRQNTTINRKQTKILNKVSTVQRNNPLNQMVPTPTTTTAIAVVTSNQNKRKRDVSLQEIQTNSTIPKSTSTISILQPPSKKIKQKRKINTIPLKKIKSNIIQQNYRRPMYLKRSSATLFQMLNKTLNYTFKEKHEQRYIYVRLNLLDQQYCLKVDEDIWESYLNIGLQQQHQWPDRLYKMAQTDNFELCHQYLIHHIETIKTQLKQCEKKLIEQSQQYSNTKFSIEQMDHYLKNYVHCQRKYLTIRNKQQLIKFKAHSEKKDTLENLSISLINEQNLIHRLLTIRQQQGNIWKELIMLRVRILCKFLPPNFDQLEQFLKPIDYSPLNNDRKCIEVRNKCYKSIQETKRLWLNLYLKAYITKIQAYDRQYQNEFTQIELQIMKSITTDHASSFIKQMKDYMSNETNKLQENIKNQMSSFRLKLLQDRQHMSTKKHMLSVSPEPYLDVISNYFDKHQWNYLSYGPSMIRSNQSATRPRKQQEVEITKLHKEIFAKVECCLIAHGMPKTHSNLKKYEDALLNYLNHSYFTPLSYKDQNEADEQAHIVASIRKTIQKHKLIIRLTDKSNNFYIGLATDFEIKAQKYFADTNAFIELSKNPLKEILDKVWNLLHQLANDKLILQKHFKQMLPDREKVELSHLYFNPKTHKDGIPVRPIENTIHSVTKNISDFLDQLIRPIFDKECKTTTIIDGTSLIKKLTEYTQQGLFNATTLFSTFDIRNLFTMLPQKQALDILVEFLDTHGHSKIETITSNTIKQLASIVLEENVFVYGETIYRQILGGAMGSSFTLTLANIFMWKWQQMFVEKQSNSKEFFGRYVDDIVITWNKSEKELRAFLDYANTWHPNIKLDYKIDKSLPFLDVLLTNDNGILTTSVYHKSAAEPYAVPFNSDHPRHVFSNIIQTGLARAVRYSSTFAAFQNEQRYIELMLLYNSYPSTFIDQEFGKFSSGYLSSSSFLPLIDNEKQYFLIRKKLTMSSPSEQSNRNIDSTRTNMDTERSNETATMRTRPSVTSTTKTITSHKANTNADKLIFHYIHENRFHSFKRDMHKLYEDHFGKPLAMNIRIIVGNRNRQSAIHELIRKRPKKAILKDIPIKKRTRKYQNRKQLVEQ